MKNRIGLLLLVCIITTSSFAQKNNNRAPEATAVEDTLSFWDIPHLKEAFITTFPEQRNDGTAVGKLNIANVNKDKIIKLAQEIGNDLHGNYDALLISHNDKLVFESYFKKGRVNLPHGQASATKGYTSIILGRAIQLGYLTMEDLDKPLVSFLKDLDPSKFVAGAEHITLHKALTMQGGLGINEEEWKIIKKDSARLKGQGLVQTLLEHSAPITPESQTYLYGNFNPIMVMTVIDAVTPKGAEHFIKTEVLDPLGITDYKWETYINGLPVAGSMVRMRSRDMLKWGSLVHHNGKWNGQQFISEAYLKKATSGLVNPNIDWMPKAYRYGYYWYQIYIPVGDKNYNATLAWGGGGQRVIVIAELGLTIVISGHDREDQIMPLISEIIVPAFVNNPQDNYPPLKDRYLGQKPPGAVPELFAPDIIKSDFREAEAAFSPDLKEFYFRRRGGAYEKNTLFVIKYENKRWIESKVPSYAGEPFVSLDGETLFLGKKYRERTNLGWGEVKDVKSMFNAKDFGIMRLTASRKGTYVFDDYKNDDVIRISTIKNGIRQEPKMLGEQINTGKWTAHPFIAPDESYLIWDSEREGGYGDNDLYISFRQKDGSWSNAINLGDKINTKHAEAFGSISPDGKYFFFHRSYGGDTGDIFWVDAKIIEDLR